MRPKIKGFCRRMLWGEKGNILIYFALGVVPFIAVAGLVVDYGDAVWCRTNMQKAVDAAALSGAKYLPNHMASQKAAELAESNYPRNDSYNIGLNNDRITVTMTRNVPTHFMRLFGKVDIPVNVKATGLKPQPVGSIKGKMMPFCIINPNTNNDPNDDLLPSKWGKRYILQFGEDNLLIQDWANGDLPIGVNAPGAPIGAKNNSEGWRGALRLDLEPYINPWFGGASAFAYNFLNGWPGTANVGDVVPVQPGNLAGPVFSTRQERLLGEEDFIFSNFNPNQDYSMDRVVQVPIVSLLKIGSTTERYTINDYYSGADWNHDYVIIDGFASFYLLTGTEQGDVNGDKKINDRDWITGLYIPGTRAPIHSKGGGGNYGMNTLPKLID